MQKHGRLKMEDLGEHTQVKECHLFGDDKSQKEKDIWDLSSRYMVRGQRKSKTSGSWITRELCRKSRYKMMKSTELGEQQEGQEQNDMCIGSLGDQPCHWQQEHTEDGPSSSTAGKEKKTGYVELWMPSFSPWLI